MDSVTSARQTPRAPSLRLREASLANICSNDKYSVPRDHGSPSRLDDVVAATLEPITRDAAPSSTTPQREALLSPPSSAHPPRTPTAATNTESGLAAVRDLCTPRLSPRKPHLLSSSSRSDQAVIVTTPQTDRGAQARSAARSRGNVSHREESLTQVALAAVLRHAEDDVLEADTALFCPNVEVASAPADDATANFVAFRCHCDGAKWCAVLKAHTESVHCLSALDILTECGISSRELTGLTLIATEDSGLDLLFQLATWNDAPHEAALRERMASCELPRLHALYRTFLSNEREATSSGNSEEVIANIDENNHHVQPRCLEKDCLEAADELAVDEAADGDEKHRQQLLAEFEATMEEMRFIQCQKDQQIQHLTWQLDEERRANMRQTADLHSQLATMRLDHACLDDELESISTALLDTQDSCVQLRRLVTENEERHRRELHEAEVHYKELQLEHTRAVTDLNNQLMCLQDALADTQKSLSKSTAALEERERLQASDFATIESRLAAALQDATEARERQKSDTRNSNAIIETLRADLSAKRNEALSIRADLEHATQAFKKTEASFESLSKRHMETTARYAEQRAQWDHEIQTVQKELYNAQQRCAALDAELGAERARAAAALAETSAAAESEVAGVREALRAAEQRCAALDAELGAERARAAAALAETSAAAESEVAGVREALRATEERYAQMDAEHTRLIAVLEEKACAAEHEAAAARAKQDAVVNCTRGIVDAVRKEYAAEVASAVDHAELLEVREALGAAEQRCAALDAELGAERARAAAALAETSAAAESEVAGVREALGAAEQRCAALDAELGAERARAAAALSETSAAAESEVAGVREALRATEERYAQMDAEHTRLIAVLEEKACAAEHEAAAARAKQDAVVNCTRGIVDAVRKEYAAEVASAVDHAELLEVREALGAAEQRCAALDAELGAERARAAAALAETSAAAESEVAGVREALRAAEQRCAALDAELGAERARAAAALAETSAAAESEVAGVREALRATEERYAQMDAEHTRLIAVLEEKACAAEHEAAAARAKQDAVVNCTRGIVDAVRKEYAAEVASAVDHAELLEVREALGAAEQRCAALDAELGAERARAAAALAETSAAAESEVAGVREALRATEERYAQMDAEHTRLIAVLEEKACAAEHEAAAARAKQDAVVHCTRGIVDAVRKEYAAEVASAVDHAELLEVREALGAAEQRCAALDAELGAERARAAAALAETSAAAESEVAGVREALRAAEQRCAALDAELGAERARAAAALAETSAAAESEVAGVREALRATEERYAQMDAEHTRLIAVLEEKACAAEHEAAAARAKQDAVVNCTRGIVDAVRKEYAAEVASAVDHAELLEVREALGAAEQRCAALDAELGAERARAAAALSETSAAAESEVAGVREALRATEERYAQMDAEHTRLIAVLEEEACAAEHEAAAARAKQDAVVNCTRGIVDAVRKEYAAEVASAVDHAELLEVREALGAAEQRCAALDAELGAERARAAAALAETSAAAESEVAGVREALRATEERYAQMDAEHTRLIAVLEEKACAAEHEAAAARAKQDAVVNCTRGIVDAVRKEYAAEVASAVDHAELLEVREALGAAEQRCAALDAELGAERARAAAALAETSAAAESEVAGVREALRATEERYAQMDAEHTRLIAVLEEKACAAEHGAVSEAHMCEESKLRRSSCLVAELRGDYAAVIDDLLTVTREIVVAREALEVATARCSALEEQRAAAFSALRVRNETGGAEVVAAKGELEKAKARYLAADAAVARKNEEDKSTYWEAVVDCLVKELADVKEKLKTVQVVNRMLRDKFRSDLRGSF